MSEELTPTDRERLPRVRLAAEAAEKIRHWLAVARQDPAAYPELADMLDYEPLSPESSSVE